MHILSKAFRTWRGLGLTWHEFQESCLTRIRNMILLWRNGGETWKAFKQVPALTEQGNRKMNAQAEIKRKRETGRHVGFLSQRIRRRGYQACVHITRPWGSFEKSWNLGSSLRATDSVGLGRGAGLVLLLFKLATWPTVRPLLKPPARLNWDCGDGKEGQGRATLEAEWAGCRCQRRGESQKSQRPLSRWNDWENDGTVYGDGEARGRSKFKEEKFRLGTTESEMPGASSGRYRES